MKANRPLVLAALTLASMALAGAARADIIPANRAACEGKATGAACAIDGQSGICQLVTGERQVCSYPDGGPIPVVPASYVGVSCGSRDAGASCVEPVNVNGSTTNVDGICQPATWTNFICIATGEQIDGGCSVSAAHAARNVGPWLLAGSFSLLIAFGRRRRRG